MRLAIPLIYCVSEDTRAKLLGRITDVDIVPKNRWVAWITPEAQRMLEETERILDEEAEYQRLKKVDNFMRQRPIHPRQVV